MKKYLVKIPLKYNKNSNLDRPDSSNDLELNFNEDINISYPITVKEGEFERNEKCNIRVYKENESFLILIEYLYADNDEYVIDMTSNLADRICYIITYLVQSQNSNLYYFHPKFTYRARDIICKEQAYPKYDAFLKHVKENGEIDLYLKDSAKMRESSHIKMICSIDTKAFNQMFDLMYNNKHLAFVVESYYRALGDIDDISKYYNLFTIIEYIEENFKDKSKAKKMFNKKQKKELIDIATNKAMKCFESSQDGDNIEKYVERFRNRFSQIISESTDKTRTEKLYTIINEYLQIEKIDKYSFNFKITESKLKKFINTRNSLFHAKKLSEEDKRQLSVLTNELMVLCTHIIKNIILM